MSRSLSICLILLLVTPALILAQGISSTQGQEPDNRDRPALVDRSGDPLPAGAVARLGTTRFRHQGAVRFVGYSADGGVVITLTGQGLHFWDARTGKEVRKLPVKSSTSRYPFRSGPSVLLSGDGKTLVLGADDGDCTVIDVATGKTRREFKVSDGPQDRFGRDNSVRSALSRDGRYLVVIGGRKNEANTNKLSVWDTSTGKLAQQFAPKDKVGFFAAAALSPDGQILVAVERAAAVKKDNGSGRDKFHVWKVATGQEIRSVASPMNEVGDLQFTFDGKSLIARSGQDQSVRLLDASTMKEVRQFSAKQGPVRGVLLSPDRKTLFVAGLGYISQYEIQTGKQLRTFPVAMGNPEEEFFGRGEQLRPFPMAVSPDGKTLAVPAMSAVTFWDVPSGKEVRQEAHQDRIDSVAFGPEGKLVLSGSADGRLYLWDAVSGKQLRQFAAKDPTQNNNPAARNRMMRLFRVRGAFSPDGKSVAGLWWGGKLHVWDTASGKLRYQLGGETGHTTFALSRDGKLVALTGSEGTLGLYTAAGRLVRTFGRQPKVDPDTKEFLRASHLLDGVHAR